MKEDALLDFYAEICKKTANASATNETSMGKIFSGMLEELSFKILETDFFVKT
jgi:hypothetical protein